MLLGDRRITNKERTLERGSCIRHIPRQSSMVQGRQNIQRTSRTGQAATRGRELRMGSITSKRVDTETREESAKEQAVELRNIVAIFLYTWRRQLLNHVR